MAEPKESGFDPDPHPPIPPSGEPRLGTMQGQGPPVLEGKPKLPQGGSAPLPKRPK
jgi:hypothetical protein